MESTTEPKPTPVPSRAFRALCFHWIHSCGHLRRQRFDAKTLCGNLRGIALNWEAHYVVWPCVLSFSEQCHTIQNKRSKKHFYTRKVYTLVNF